MTVILTELLEIGEKVARSTMIGRKQQFDRCYILIGEGRTYKRIAAPWDADDEFEKLAKIAEVRAWAHEMPAQAMLLVTEAWMSKVPVGTDLAGYRASHDPNRQETVTAIANDGRRTFYKAWEIHRDRKGRVADLELMPLPVDVTDSPGGVIVDGIIPHPFDALVEFNA